MALRGFHSANRIPGSGIQRVVLLAGLATAFAVAGQEGDQTTPPPPAFEGTVAANARAFLNELSTRRRVTTLFENRQSAFHGVQENFVNTSAGNLTFLVRDLVRVGGMPIVMGRVYDSSFHGYTGAGGDFGPGWKLAVRESLSERPGRLVYTDASNAAYVLEVRGTDIVPAKPALSPVSSGTLHRTRAVSFVELNVGATVRRFVKRHPPRPHATPRLPKRPWRLTEVTHPRGWLRIEWRGGSIAGLASDAGSLEFGRRADGRILEASDDLGRSVSYEYDDDGRLAAATDLSGAKWRYSYAEGGALTAVVDPRGKTVLAASHAGGRTATIRALHAETTFHYGTATTRAVDGLGRTTTFHRTAQGLTTGVADAVGRLTQLAFDEALRPVSITRNGTAVVRMDYDGAGRLSRLWRPDGASTYAYGEHGMTAVGRATTARYRYESGRIAHADDAGGVREYAYTNRGVLAAATVDGVETRFAGPSGRRRRRTVAGRRTVARHRTPRRRPRRVHRPGRRRRVGHGSQPLRRPGLSHVGGVRRPGVVDARLRRGREPGPLRPGHGRSDAAVPALRHRRLQRGDPHPHRRRAGRLLRLLFVPPEYRAVNCFVCSSSVQSTSVVVDESPVVAREGFDILLSTVGTCTDDLGIPVAPT